MHFALAGSVKFQKLLLSRWKSATIALKKILADVRAVTICLDGWSKTNLSSSFLCLSACFFDPASVAVRHAVLKIAQIEHPHTGEMLSEVIEQCLSEWGLTASKVMMIVSDNGANMIKAVRLLNEKIGQGDDNNEVGPESSGDETQHESSGSEELDDSSDNDSVNEEPLEIDDDDDFYVHTDVHMIELADLQEITPYRRLMCIAHSLQLVIKKAYSHYDGLIAKVHRLIGKLKKSSKAVEKIKQKSGKVLLSDNTTRWNSTFRMGERLIELKDIVNEVLNDMKVDSLLVSEWSRLGELCELLKPFAVQTDKLQSDSKCLSYVLPSLYELECHLQTCNAPKSVTKAMLQDMQSRFQSIRDPSFGEFNALPAAACLIDPTVAPLLMTPEMSTMLESAKEFIITEVGLL